MLNFGNQSGLIYPFRTARLALPAGAFVFLNYQFFNIGIPLATTGTFTNPLWRLGTATLAKKCGFSLTHAYEKLNS
jgi:hypothetical protein